MHQEVLRNQESLERLFLKAGALERVEEVDDEVKAHFTRYLCVKTSAFLELSIEIILKEYVVSVKADPLVANYVFHHLERSSAGPRRDEIMKLLGRFSNEWRRGFGKQTDNVVTESLNSLVVERNKIAHGKDHNLSLSLNELRAHFENAKKVVEIIDQQCVTTDNPPSFSTTTS